MRMIDADSLESKLPAHSNDSNHVMTRNFAVESFRALIKAEPTQAETRRCTARGQMMPPCPGHKGVMKNADTSHKAGMV